MKNRILSAVAAIGLIAGLAGCAGPSGPTAAELRSATVPEGVVYAAVPEGAPPAPDGELVLADGSIAVSELTADRPVVLFFFESWCGTCAVGQAGLNAAVERYGDAVTFVGVASASEVDAIADYGREHEVAYALARDPGGELARAFAVDEAPFTVLLAEGNRLLRGWPDYPEHLEAAIAELVVERLPD